MRLGTIAVDGKRHVALLQRGCYAAVHGAAASLGVPDAADLPHDVLEIIRAGPDAWQVAENLATALAERPLEDSGHGVWWWEEAAVKVQPPLLPPKNPWVIGANNLAHLAAGFARLGRAPVGPTYVEFFTKSRNSIIGDGDDVVYSKAVSVTLDYEAELAVVIGKGGKDIPVSQAMNHVFGYTVANDMSAREIQVQSGQYYRGKSLDGFCPLGPVVATTRHVPDINQTQTRTFVNGELRQDWPTGDLLFKVDQVISVLSQGMTLEPGDVIICGTYPGTGFESMPQLWLQHGDVVECEITRIGHIRNTIRQREVLIGDQPRQKVDG